MTDISAGPVAPHRDPRPSSPLRRALGLEWHRHRSLLALYVSLAAAIVLIAVFLDVRLGAVAILLAAHLPADLADRVPEEGRQLRAALGISRAEAVRARTLVVCLGQLVLALGAAGAILLSDWSPGQRHWNSVMVSDTVNGPQPMTGWDHLVDIGMWSGALLWTHALTGGAAFQLGARPSKLQAVGAFLGSCLVAGLVMAGTLLLTSWALMTLEPGSVEVLRNAGTDRFELAVSFGQGIGLLLALGGGILALVLARRRWMRRA